MRLIIVISIIFIFSPLSAQSEQTAHDFFPHHVGDIWEYLNDYNEIIRTIIVKDSIGQDGLFYIENSQYAFWPEFILDTTNATVFIDNYYGYSGLSKIYRLDAQLGESWTVAENQETKHIDKITDDNYYDVMGHSTRVKTINYFEVIIDFSDTLSAGAQWLAEGFGIIAIIPEMGLQYGTFIQGAKINGITYGTLTPIERHSHNESNLFMLNNNYPNPFNSSTTISFSLQNRNIVLLEILNPKGKLLKP